MMGGLLKNLLVSVLLFSSCTVYAQSERILSGAGSLMPQSNNMAAVEASSQSNSPQGQSISRGVALQSGNRQQIGELTVNSENRVQGNVSALTRSSVSIGNTDLGSEISNNIIGPATGSITGPATGSITGPATGSITGPVTGSITGPATGSITGPAAGNIIGPRGESVAGPGVEAMMGPSARGTIESEMGSTSDPVTETDAISNSKDVVKKPDNNESGMIATPIIEEVPIAPGTFAKFRYCLGIVCEERIFGRDSEGQGYFISKVVWGFGIGFESGGGWDQRVDAGTSHGLGLVDWEVPLGGAGASAEWGEGESLFDANLELEGKVKYGPLYAKLDTDGKLEAGGGLITQAGLYENAETYIIDNERDFFELWNELGFVPGISND